MGEVPLHKQFSHLLATHRHEIMNNGSNSEYFWRDSEVLVLYVLYKNAQVELQPLFMISDRRVANSYGARSTSPPPPEF